DEAFTTQHGSPVKNADAFVAKQKGDPLVTPSVGVQGVYAASEETYAKAKEISERRDVRLHTHLSETRGEVEAHRKKTGLRPVEWLEKIGFLGDRVTAAHCVWVTMNEIRALARRGTTVAPCPVSNMKLASGGVAPVPEMIDAGVVVGLGTDSPISNNGMDVFADMKVAALLHKATRWDARVMSAQTVLDLATIQAARALHVEREIGSIEVGKRADLAVVSLKGAHTTPFYPETVIRHLVYSGRGSDVQATIVDGQILMSGGVVRTVDEPDVIARAQETARELFEECAVIVGVGEAGRGPVLGPLVVAGVAVESDVALRHMNVRDSKKLSPEKREAMAPEIEKLATWELLVIPAEEIDLMRAEMSLNDFEAKLFAQLIERLHPEIAYVDAADVDAIEFKRCVQRELPFAVEVVSQHNADELF